MVIKYVADDGKEFECEEDCLDYERKAGIETFKDQIRMFDEKGRTFPASRGIEDAYYLEVTTDDAADALKEFCAETGDCTPWSWSDTPEAGRWYYDSDNDEWYSVQDLIDKVKKIENIFNPKQEKKKDEEITPFPWI